MIEQAIAGAVGLAFCSVFIVVLSVVIVNSVISKGPLIFLSLAEGLQGGYDGIIHGDYENHHFGHTQQTTRLLNYTQVLELYSDESVNLSPR